MKFSAICDLVLDIYYDEKLNYIGCDGGITAANIVANLSSFGLNTKCYGVCGNDYYGNLAIKSLKDCNVKVDIKKLSSISTRAYFIRRVLVDGKMCFKSIKYCPFCKKSSWYDDSCIYEKEILKKITNKEILIFDNLNSKNQYIINNTNNLKLLDLGLFDELDNLSNMQIISKLNNNFEIVNLNQRVENFLLERLNLKDDIELLNIIKCKLLIITRGDKGCDLIYRNKKYTYPLKKVEEEIDDSGAGDLFFSTIIKNWAMNNFKITSSKFNKWVREASKNSSEIVKLIGSRRLIKDLYRNKLKMICNCGGLK
jgi:sugar/nucleoside kinase (ribokinase family)